MHTPDYMERWRPQYHYSTLDSHVGDPNGLVYYKGIYHLYYQQIFIHEPKCKTAVGQHWGHATSTDLIHWQEQDTALFPDDLGFMWSGTGVVDHNNTSGFFSDTEEKQGIVIAYSTNTQHIGIAYSKDDGKTFIKVSTTTPVIKNPGIRCFRDPHIFWHPETQKWKMVVAGHSGIIWIYEAADLVHWKLCSANKNITTECPNLIRMTVEGSDEEKWVLTCVGREYFVGTFDGYRFRPETDRIALNEGPDAYAGITFSDMPDGRTVMISWMFALLNGQEEKWDGCFTIPVELKLVKIGTSYRILQRPIQELSLIKENTLSAIHDKQYMATVNPLDGIRSNCFELHAEIDLARSEIFSINVCEGLSEKIILTYNKTSGCISIKKHNNVHGPKQLKHSVYNFYIDPESIAKNTLKLHLLVDISTFELFVNDGYYYFVMRIQPCASSQNMSIQYDGSLFIRNLTVTSCKSIWFEDWKAIQAEYQTDGEVSNPAEEVSAAPAIVDEIGYLHPVWYWFNKTFEHGGDDYFQKNRAGQAREILVNIDDFSIPVDIKLHGEGIADMLFRMLDMENFYCVSMNAYANRIVLWKKFEGQITKLCDCSLAFSVNRLYHFQIEAIGNNINISFEGQPLFHVTDDTFITGRFAVNTYIADAEFLFGAYKAF